MQIESGQSLQPFLFWPSGQQGMSVDIADVADTSIVAALESRFAATGITNGGKMSPTIKKAASKRQMSR
jgi:hypothetical protein